MDPHLSITDAWKDFFANFAPAACALTGHRDHAPVDCKEIKKHEAYALAFNREFGRHILKLCNSVAQALHDVGRLEYTIQEGIPFARLEAGKNLDLQGILPAM